MPEPKLYGVGDVDDAAVETLRTRFMERIQKDDLKGNIDPTDIRRMRTDPLWLKRFVAHGDLDVDSALKFMIDTFKFRHEMKVNAMTMQDIDQALLDKGVICPHGVDKDGKRIVIFNARLHERGRMEECKLYLTYWLEKIEREEHGERITMFFDMANAGLSSVDIPFISYLINLFKFYYPDMLNAIIVFELPWIMNAAWKIVKNLLPPKSHQLIKFASKKDVGDLLDTRYRLTRWGGSEEWEYHFNEEECKMPASPFLGDQENGVASDHSDEPKLTNGHAAASRKSSKADSRRSSSRSRERTPVRQPVTKFHSMLEESAPATHTGAGTAKVRFSDDPNKSISEDLSESVITEADESTTELDGMLEICPGEEVWFGAGASGSKRTLELTNIRGGPVAFKVKTTSPEKFRVRPSAGVVGTGRRQTVQLELCDGVSPQHVITDRFLLVAAAVPHERVPPKDMGRLWRSLPTNEKLEHRLRCAARPTANEPLVALVRTLGSRLDTVGAKLEQQQKRTEQAEELYRSTRRKLGAVLVLIGATLVLNLYLTYTAIRCKSILACSVAKAGGVRDL